MGYNPRLDTALRNRLTGAVILVLLAVLLLPELLTGSGRNPAPAPAADPGSGPPRQTYQVDLSGDATAPAGATAAAVPVPTPGLNDVPVELPVPSAPATVAPKPVEPAPDAAPSASASVPAQPTPKPARPQPTTPQPVSPPAIARAPAVAPAAPPAAPREAAAGGRQYFVQVGTFTTRERAEMLRSDLARRRFDVSINETARDTKRFYRVRVGPVADRKAAEALEVRLRPLAPDRAIVALP